MEDLSNLWPLIEDAAAKHNLDPDLIAAIVQTESAAEPRAVRYEPHVGRYVLDPEKHRPEGCSADTEKRLQMMRFGLMQVMGFNIRGMGFTGWLTEYLEPVKGLEVGCRFLADLLTRWPSVEDAVSAYNQGSPTRDGAGRYGNQHYVDLVMTLYRALSRNRRDNGDSPAPVETPEAPAAQPKYHFSPKSARRLAECDPRLQKIMNAAIAHPDCPMDFTILCGHRGEAEQNDAYRRGASKLRFPQSRHNKLPSLAVDIAPCPIDWTNIDRFDVLAGHIKKVAAEQDIEVAWGGDWRSFKDYPHWQV